MKAKDAKMFWNAQTSSLHRSDTPDFYEKKAQEHASLMTQEDCESSCVDLGCGAGELLFYLLDQVNVKVGLDYSESMLSAARQKLQGKTISLRSDDIFEYLPQSDCQVWTTTGAINQYLSEEDMAAVLDIFVRNKSVRAFYLFDCVDPIRYFLMPHGIGYRAFYGNSQQNSAVYRKVVLLAHRIRTALRLALGFPNRLPTKLGSMGMGWGYPPSHWFSAAETRGLGVEVVSSRYYEYRYHVILRKPAGK